MFEVNNIKFIDFTVTAGSRLVAYIWRNAKLDPKDIAQKLLVDGTVKNNHLANEIKIGDLSNLTTSSKGSVVDAINEIAIFGGGSGGSGSSSVNIYKGFGTFNGQTGRKITHNLNTLNYVVFITPISMTSPSSVGEYWITKESDAFIVKCTGTDVTTTFDWAIVINDNSIRYKCGNGKFNSTTGVTITHNWNMADYSVIITPSANANLGAIGEYWVENKTANSFVIKNSGPDIISTFDWVLFR